MLPWNELWLRRKVNGRVWACKRCPIKGHHTFGLIFNPLKEKVLSDNKFAVDFSHSAIKAIASTM